jgi:hypothetical protein
MTDSRFFVSSAGDLYRDDNFSEPFREKFRFSHGGIRTTKEFKATLRNGPYAWPGGYPLYFYMHDAAVLCFGCAGKEAKQIIRSIREKQNDWWRVIGCEINHEDPHLTCCHCNEKIESAHGDDSEEEE